MGNFDLFVNEESLECRGHNFKDSSTPYFIAPIYLLIGFVLIQDFQSIRYLGPFVIILSYFLFVKIRFFATKDAIEITTIRLFFIPLKKKIMVEGDDFNVEVFEAEGGAPQYCLMYGRSLIFSFMDEADAIDVCEKIKRKFFNQGK